MHDKVVLVTGATAGIGRVTAREIARMGATVVIGGRHEAKCKDVIEKIRRETGNANVDYLLADFSSIRQTRAAAEDFKARYARLDLLVNNVGAIFLSRGETEDGLENTWALNHLAGYFYLTQLLLDLIRASAPARIVNVSSRAHYRTQMNFTDLQGWQKYSGPTAYAQSKLANVMFTYELARRLEGTGVTVNALHPGMVASNFGVTNNKSWLKPFRKVFDLFSISEEEGAQTSIYLATSPEVAGVTGKYFDECREKRSSAASYNEADQRRLWEISEQMLAVKTPERSYSRSPVRPIPATGPG